MLRSDIPEFNRHWLMTLKRDCRPLSIDDNSVKNEINKRISCGKPFIVTRSENITSGIINLGLCIPSEKKGDKPVRIGFTCSIDDIKSYKVPLKLSSAVSQFPALLNSPIQELSDSIADLRLDVYLYGSWLWEIMNPDLTGFVSGESDIDLIVKVNSLEQCCLVHELFVRWGDKYGKKIDGEFLLPDNSFISQEEFFRKSSEILVKGIDFVTLKPRKLIYELLLNDTSYSVDYFSMPITDGDSLFDACGKITDAAIKAMFIELCCFPKPGLVSFLDSGSHVDMDYEVFVKAILTLRPFFNQIALQGTKAESFKSLKITGIDAENAMLKATCGINTHRGTIFSLGLLVAATAYTVADGVRLTPENIRNNLMSLWKEELSKHKSDSGSHGNIVRKKYGIKGIRGEAATGFPSVFDCGLNTLYECEGKSYDFNRCLIQVFFRLLKQVDDTNMIFRKGLDGLKFAHEKAISFLEGGGVSRCGWRNEALSIHKQFIERNLSPGGIADLLICIIFINLACNSSSENEKL